MSCFELFKLLFLYSRNSLLSCSQIPSIDLTPWQSQPAEEDDVEHVEVEPEIKETLKEMNQEMLEAAIERAKLEMEERKRFEYESWLASKCNIQYYIKDTINIILLNRWWHKCQVSGWYCCLLQQSQ